MALAEADWMTSSRPYRILAHAIALKRKGQLETTAGKEWMVLAKQTEQELEQDHELTDYGRFRLRGYQKAMAN